MLFLANTDYFKTGTSFFTKISNENNNMSHTHEFIEIFYVISGSALHSINGHPSMIDAGDMFILKKSDSHFFKSKNGEPLVHRDILIKEEAFKELCDGLSSDFYQNFLDKPTVPLKIRPSKIEKLESQFARIQYLSFSMSQQMNLLFKFAILNILELYIDNELQILTTQNPSTRLISSILETIDRPSSLSMSASDVLKGLQYDHSYICKLFKSYTHMTITEYINRNRLEYAYTLMKNSKMSLNEIALTTGYQNYSYFYRTFTNHFKITPKKAQKEVRKYES